MSYSVKKNDEIGICPCGSDKSFNSCCGLLILKKQLTPSPLALMKSRYSAFALGYDDYIAATMMGPALKLYKQQDAGSAHIDWQKLEILQTVGNTVEFRAFYKTGDKLMFMQEKSMFKQWEGRWYYFKGQKTHPGRNEPCPCERGKKYKLCCALK